MKALAGLTAAALLTLSTMSTPVNALTIPWEQYSPSGGFSTSYDIALIDDVIYVQININLIGDTPSAYILDKWETGIETMWSTDEFDTKIVVDVVWTDTNYDFTVNVVDDYGRTTTATWYTYLTGWGNSYQDEVAAHECGHYLGLWDEYVGGATGPNATYTTGIMGTLTGGTFDYYYDAIFAWLDGPHDSYGDSVVLAGNEPTNTQPVPEPATLFLLGVGLLGLGGLRKRLK